MYSVNSCPICKGTSFNQIGTAKDHTVSHETFTLRKCGACDFLLTSPRPQDEELGKYYLSPDYVSHTAKATTLFDKLYEITREFALQNKLTLVKKFLPCTNSARTLLDYGCGTGYFLKKAKENGFNIAGVEPSLIARNSAEKIVGQPIQTDITETKGTFDAITLWHVLEHVPDLNELLQQLKSKLSPNGKIFIAVPNYKSPDGQKYNMNWAGYDVPRHLWHFEQKTMINLLRNNGFKLIDTIPMKLDSYYVSMLSEKYLAGKQTVITFLKGLVSGFSSNMNAQNKNYSSIIYIAHQE
jgi:2-polyprenyl-3-methyl-5-hydroxy-6-metoxy-1,4-benzoquinol methylase